MKKILIIFFGIFILLNQIVSANNLDNEIKITGPKNLPKIIGPKVGPPTREEINKIKYTRDPEFINKNKESKEDSGFLDWLYSLLSSWF